MTLLSHKKGKLLLFWSDWGIIKIGRKVKLFVAQIIHRGLHSYLLRADYLQIPKVRQKVWFYDSADLRSTTLCLFLLLKKAECIKKFLARGKLGLNEMIKLSTFKIRRKLSFKMQTNLRLLLNRQHTFTGHDRHRRQYNALSEPEFGGSKVVCREF